ncbi:MAG: hypothetical protein ACYCWC_12625 [Rhodocyclaceae bacterium]
MTVENLLDRLEGVKAKGPGRWSARCPAHGDKSPSLSIRELDDGRVLLKCFTGCTAAEIVGAAGLKIEDLFPPREIQNGKPERRPFPAADALRAVGFEALVVVAAASALITGEPLSTVDRDRLLLASSRIQDALRGAGL